MRAVIYCIILGMVVIMNGCLPRMPSVATGPVSRAGRWTGGIEEAASVDDLLVYYNKISALSRHKIEQEKRQAAAAAQQGRAMARLQLALLYLLPNDKNRAPGKALEQLEALAKSKLTARPAFAALIRLLKEEIRIQKTMQLKTAVLNNNLRKAEHDKKKMALKLQKNQQETASLARQIQQLKEIERIMDNKQKR